jgi:hypothetical protein
MMKKYCVLMAFVIFVFSCSNDFLSLGQKEDVMPQVTAPVVKSFENENDISIEWDYDKGADEYILYRDEAADGAFSEILYSGKGLSFKDNILETEKFYYYKLAKKQGYKEFDKSKYVPGILSIARKDAYEDNNTKETAKSLDDYTLANIYYYKDNFGNEFEDKDWYYVDIEAWHKLTIQIQQYKFSPAATILNDNDVCFNLEGGSPANLVVDQEIEITNSSKTQTQRYYFQISVNKAPMTNKIKNYILKIFSESPL